MLSAAEGGRKTPFISDFKPQFFFRTANITGTVYLDSTVSIAMPGDSLSFKVTLIDYAPLNIGLHFIFRESHTTVGAVLLLNY